MVAVTATFVISHEAESVDDFCDVFDLSRMLFHSGRSMTVVCNICQTVNRHSAKFCKGCTGKLPAFHLASAPDNGAFAEPDRASQTGRLAGELRALNTNAVMRHAKAGQAVVRAALARVARVSRVPSVWVAMLLVLLFAAFWLWYVGRAAETRWVAVQAPVSRSAAHATYAVDTFATSALTTTPLHAVRAPLQETRADLPRGRAPLPLTRPRAAAPAIAPAAIGPLALCRSLNFFANAVCMNNRCAQRAVARHPQCADALRQRRLDEARRNPMMIN
jgi:hypothetical protein